MKLLLACLLLSVASVCQAGEWTRTSPTSIAFSGEIEKDELTRFLAVYKPTDKSLVVNSPGGSMEPALTIGEILIKNQNLTVTVTGMCASSCANYIFMAAHHKIIDHGIVGFHGDWKAMVASDNFKKEAATIKPGVLKPLLAFHLQKVQEETAFMRLAGVDQELFDKTQKENDAGLYDVYAPNEEVFAQYGVHVIGQPDKAVLADWPGLKVQFDDGISPAGPTANITK